MRHALDYNYYITHESLYLGKGIVYILSIHYWEKAALRAQSAHTIVYVSMQKHSPSNVANHAAPVVYSVS